LGVRISYKKHYFKKRILEIVRTEKWPTGKKSFRSNIITIYDSISFSKIGTTPNDLMQKENLETIIEKYNNRLGISPTVAECNLAKITISQELETKNITIKTNL
jgi:hypothetical protein